MTLKHFLSLRRENSDYQFKFQISEFSGLTLSWIKYACERGNSSSCF